MKKKSKGRFSLLFLIDGIGALVSALMLAFVLTKWAFLLGVSSAVLYVLAGVACVLALYL
jgi:hypothetical protein